MADLICQRDLPLHITYRKIDTLETDLPNRSTSFTNHFTHSRDNAIVNAVRKLSSPFHMGRAAILELLLWMLRPPSAFLPFCGVCLTVYSRYRARASSKILFGSVVPHIRFQTTLLTKYGANNRPALCFQCLSMLQSDGYAPTGNSKHLENKEIKTLQ